MIPRHLGLHIIIRQRITTNPTNLTPAHVIAAAQVNITANSHTQPLVPESIVGLAMKLHHPAHELVPQHSSEAHVALQDFQVGVADAGAEDFNESVVGRGDGRDGTRAECAVGERGAAAWGA